MWLACHGDVAKAEELPRVQKDIDGEKVLKFSCRDFIKDLYERKSKCQSSTEKIVKKMMQENHLVSQMFSEF